jgi:cytochrome c
MNPKRTLPLLVVAALSAGSASAMATGETGTLDGSQLYQTKACLSCHGADGRTPIVPIYPKIAGQQADYLYNQLRDIKSGARNSGQAAIMMGLMAGVSDQEMRAIADWLATQ